MSSESDVGASSSDGAAMTVSFEESFYVWLRVAMLSFGGPAAQIAVMHRLIVDEKKWLDERRFLHALNFCMLLPGPEAQQLATYIGWLMHGVRGGLMAGVLFILPGFVSMLLLSIMYVSFQNSFTFQSLFFGLKCAVLAVIAQAVLRVSKRVLKNRFLVCIAVSAFLLLWLKLLSFPAVIVCAALAGMVAHRIAPELLSPARAVQERTEPDEPDQGGVTPIQGDEAAKKTVVSKSPITRAEVGRSLRISVICLSLWFLPIAVVAQIGGRDSVYTQSSMFFSKAAVLTFGGAYSVLSYVDQQAVEKYQWLEKGEMVDGLGLAETTPGPLIMVVQFVGFLAAWRHGVDLPPLLGGICGAVLTTWVTFVPCFFWIFLGAPYVEKALHSRWLASTMTAITASVVGVIATLGMSFAIATLFAERSVTQFGWATLTAPVWSTIQPGACLISLLAMALIFVFKRGLAMTLTVSVIGGILYRVAFP